MALIVNDKVRLTVIGTLFGQSIQNVFDYQILVNSTQGDTSIALADMAQAFFQGTNPGLSMLACQSPQYVNTGVRAQVITPARSRFILDPTGEPGTHPSDCTVPNIAATITKYGPFGTRSNIGSTHIAGIPDGVVSAGTFVPAYQTLLNTFASRFTNIFTVPAETTEARMVIFQTATPLNTRAVVQAVARTTVRTMRRRTLGVGI